MSTALGIFSEAGDQQAGRPQQELVQQRWHADRGGSTAAPDWDDCSTKQPRT